MTDKAREYKNQFTLDGRLRPQLGVTEAKVRKVKGLYEKAMAGDIVADAQLREMMFSGDASLSMAHLTNINFIPQLDKLTRSVEPIVGSGFRSTKDFNPVVLMSLFGNLTGTGIGANGEAIEVPEGTAYPKVSITGRESFYTKLTKRGVSFDFTWEAKVNDAVGFFGEMPSELLTLTDTTEYAEVFDALLQASQTLPSVTLPDGTVVPVNSPATPNGIFAAILALGERSINGNKIGTLSGYNVIVPTGRKLYVDYALKQWAQRISIQDGSVTFAAPDDSVLSTVTVIESDRLSGVQWILQPKPGSTKRPVLELLRLRGYETPELRVKADAGMYLSGGNIPGIEGSFDADTISYRYRYVVGGVLWDDTFIVRSEGDGN